MKFAYFVALLWLTAIAPAWAQQSILQSGNWTVGDVPKYTNPSSGFPVVVDSGLIPGQPIATVVASLPTCNSTTQGQVYVVTDALTPSYGATLTGGSSTYALALCNGSAWKAH